MITKVGLYCVRGKKKPWFVRWYGEPHPETGKQARYSKAFKLKRDAELFQAEKEAEFMKGGRRDRPEELKIKTFCENWLKIHRTRIRYTSRLLYEDAIQRLVNHFGPNKLISKITPMEAEYFIAHMKPERKDLVEKGTDLSNWTVKKYIRDFKTMFKAAVKWEMIPKNPFEDVKPPKLVLRPWHYLNASQYWDLSDAVEEDDLHTKAMYALGYTAGLRYGEMASLLWQNIDFENSEVIVQNQPGTEDMPPFYIKDYESRTVPLPEHTLAILRKLKMKAPKRIPYVLLDEIKYDNMVSKWHRFQKEKRQWKNSDVFNNVRRRFIIHWKRAGIKPTGTFSLHTLRKCCGKNWADHLPPNVTKELMGHSNIETTMKYYNQVDKEQRLRAAQVVNDLVTSVEAKRLRKPLTAANETNRTSNSTDTGQTPKVKKQGGRVLLTA